MAAFELFEGLSKSEIKHIFDFGVIRPVEAGEVLFRKGDVGQDMYIVLTGKIDIVEECDTGSTIGVVPLAELGPGELLGEMAMFDKSHKRSAHALAKESSQVLALSEDTLSKLTDKKIPRKFLVNMIGALCHRLRLTSSMYLQAKYGCQPAPDGK